MPRDHKKYDRKGKKRKRDEIKDVSQRDEVQDKKHFHQHPSRRTGHDSNDYPKERLGVNHESQGNDDGYGDEATIEEPIGGHDEFYGILSDDDQAYFKRIEAMLELDQFDTPEDKSLLLDSAWREADGKELKLACSQSCSRVLERLVKLSRPAHLKKLFQSFSSHFLFLVQHRFASHCCETLFLSAAPMVTEELIAPLEPTEQDDDPHAVHVSLENLFLYTVNELSEHLGFLMMDRFASHPLRVLIVALSGKPLADTLVVSAPPKSKDATSQWRTVPQSFHEAVQGISTAMLGGLETHYLRTIVTNPNASQLIQRLLELEFTQSSKPKAQDSLFRRLVPEDTPAEDSDTSAFLKGMLYDVAGSRILEVIFQCAPSKSFKGLYRSCFGGQLVQMAKKDIASFVLIRLLERLREHELATAIESLSAEMHELLNRQRYGIIRVMVERSRACGLDTQPIVASLDSFYGPPGAETITSLLQPAPLEKPEKGAPEPDMSATRHHARLLAETMLTHPSEDPARGYITTLLLLTPDITLNNLSKDRHSSHVVQTALKAQLPSSILRPLIQNLLPHTVALASDAVGSHVVDALWYATDDSLFFMKERIAERLAAHEAQIRETLPGRAVLRNWRVELFGRRRVEWIAKAKGRRSGAEFGAEVSGTGMESAKGNQKAQQAEQTATNDGKSAIEKARERWAAKQQGKGQKKGQDARVVRVR